VRLAPEILADSEVTVRVEDFKVPEDEEAWLRAAKDLIRHALRGRRAFVGCRGGVGRTGMMIATVAKILGETSPVFWTRRNWRREAIETLAQERFVQGLDVSPIQGWLRRRRTLRRLSLGLIPW
jgi:protein-tyrosine phosphatase